MIPDQTIARIRESLNLAEIVREHVPTLKKRGRNFIARCPFHQERTPSFNVNPEMGVFKCFGCGAGGDAFKFLMLTEALTYPEAIRKLAVRAGVTIEEEKSETVTAEAKEKQVLYGLLEEAATFYHRHLLESPEADTARKYLAKRGLTTESLEKFKIGFAPASGMALRNAATKKGLSIDMLVKAGLVRRKDDGRILDAFWNRIMFPIWDTQGRLIAFGGRAMGEALPKYINSSETPVYSKSRHLYGLFQGLSTLRKSRHIIILEGYMDVVTCHQFGLDTTAATLGTALTEEHVKILRKYADRVTLLFDPDAAGAQASLRGGELLISDGFEVDVVTLPDGADADEILVAKGRAVLDDCISSGVSFMDYFIAAAQKRHPGTTPDTKLAIAEDVLPLIQKMKDPLLQDEYLGRLANVLRVEKAVLGQQMKRVRSTSPRETAKTGATTESKSEALDRRILTIEEEMLLIAFQYPSDEVRQLLDGVAWADVRCQEAWKGARTIFQGKTLQVSEALASLSEELREWLTPVVLNERQYAQPLSVLRELTGAWRRHQEAGVWQALKSEIDSMIDGRIPFDAGKVQHYNDLSKRLKGSRSDLNTLREAPLHG